jgi:hypothetical protein
VQEVISIRQVSCKAGYPYYAVGLYRAAPRVRDGKLTYRLVRDLTSACRSTRPEFHGVAGDPRLVSGVRHGSPVPTVPPAAIS